jgi:hypothetical protein
MPWAVPRTTLDCGPRWTVWTSQKANRPRYPVSPALYIYIEYRAAHPADGSCPVPGAKLAPNSELPICCPRLSRSCILTPALSIFEMVSGFDVRQPDKDLEAETLSCQCRQNCGCFSPPLLPLSIVLLGLHRLAQACALKSLACAVAPSALFGVFTPLFSFPVSSNKCCC